VGDCLSQLCMLKHPAPCCVCLFTRMTELAELKASPEQERSDVKAIGFPLTGSARGLPD
jgi:hypothetical protein